LHRCNTWAKLSARNGSEREGPPVRATQQDGSYPRPQLRRERWVSLDGAWEFAHDDADAGLRARWFEEPTTDPFDRTIRVPYPPESPASGIGDSSPHPVVWYRRRVRHDQLAPVAAGDRVLVHFGAVDHRAQVWFDGRLVAGHVGGQTPFTADVTDAMTPGAEEHVLVVRAEDDPVALEQPRGKQDWRERPHGIWYERTSGIWQSVWSETVPRDHIAELAWWPDVPGGVVRGEVTLARVPAGRLVLELRMTLGEEILVEQSTVVRSRTTTPIASLDVLRNGQDRTRLLWSPEHPVLIDVELVLREAGSGRVVDSVASYVGLRTTSVGGGTFQLNGRPYYVRAVLNQGYRPRTHLASSGSDELRAEVELARSMGFNAVRVHQKAEDPRFLYWADRLGLLVWAETAGAYEFSAAAVGLLAAEWTDLVRRDRSHPAIMAWVPVNESWGVQDIAVNPAQQHYARALAGLTRALDPSRPVMSNEGWEHVDSDILGLHDYTTDPEQLRRRYRDQDAAAGVVLAAHGPHGRRPVLNDAQAQAFRRGDAPLMITEFGGVSVTAAAGTWGYAHAGSDSEYATLLLALFDAVRSSPVIAGFCYTQFMDTGQETNGLLFADGTPKLPIESLRHIVTGLKDGAEPVLHSTSGWQDRPAAGSPPGSPGQPPPDVPTA
jgi:beta-galactosidase/beta-glucuronidase